MNEFNLLFSLKNHLQAHIPGQIVVLNPEQKTDDGCCLVTIDEISPATITLLSSDIQSRVKFHTTCFHDSVGLKDSLERSQVINSFLDGHTISLKKGAKATIKMISSTIEISRTGQEKTVSYYYDSIIRG